MQIGAMDMNLGGFDPLQFWDHAYWTEGTEFQALAYANGDPVGAWPDEITADSLTPNVPGDSPLFVSSEATFNNKPVIRFDGVSDHLRDNFLSLSQPNEIVCVARFRALGADWVFSGSGVAAAAGYDLRPTNAVVWRMAAPTAIDGGGVDTSLHLLRFVANGAASELFVDEVSVLSGNAGTGAIAGVRIGQSSAGTGSAQLDIAFWAVKNGLLTAGERSDLHAFFQSHYGTP